MDIFNASFIFGHGREDEFLRWFEQIRRRFEADLPERCAVSALRDANGEAHTEHDAHTIAVQWEFDNIKEARNWRDNKFINVSEDFMRAFGPEAIVFTSIFEKLRT